jgi:hypothetical protein
MLKTHGGFICELQLNLIAICHLADAQLYMFLVFIIFKLDFDHVTAVSSLMDRLLDLSKNSL